MKKRLLSMVLAVLMLLTLLPVGAMADGATSGTYTAGGISYTLSAGTLTVSGTGTCTDAWRGYFDTNALVKLVFENSMSLQQSAFANCTNLTSITMPKTMAEGISALDWCFSGCANIKNMVTVSDTDKVSYTLDNGTLTVSGTGESRWQRIFDGVVKNAPVKKLVIGEGITAVIFFGGLAELEEVSLSDTVTKIGSDAFGDCSSLTSAVIPDSVETIGTGAFSGCSKLERVYIGSGTKKIGDSGDIFGGCESLTEINVSSANKNYTSVDGVLYSKDKTVLIRYPGGKSGEFKVNSMVTEISAAAFSFCRNLTSVYIPDSVECVYSGTFGGCSKLERIDVSGGNEKYSSLDGVLYNKTQTTLVQYPGGKKGSFSIPSTVTSINTAFMYCEGLTLVFVPETVTHINRDAFGYCPNLFAIDFSASHPDYASHDGVWYNKDITELIKCPEGREEYIMPNSVASIGSHSMDNCGKLNRLVIGNAITSIYDFDFDEMPNLETLEMGTGITEIHPRGDLWNSPFNSHAHLKSVTIGSAVTLIGDNTFNNCTALEELIIPDSVLMIGSQAFSGCKGLKTVKIGNGVASIGWLDNAECQGLENLTIGNKIKEVRLGYNYSKLKLLAIGSGADDISLESCQALDTLVVSPENPNYTAEDDVLYDKEKTTLLFCPYTKTSIEIPGSVKDLTYRFGSARPLESVIISEGVTTIAESIFEDCASLKSVSIPDSVTAIGEHAFMNCENLTDITVGNGITALGAGTFFNTGYYNDDSNWENGLLYLGGWLLHSDAHKTSHVIKEGTKGIAPFSFNGTNGMSSVYIPTSVKTIGLAAFQICNRLKNVYYGGTQAQWGAIDIAANNYGLLNATIHYGSAPHTHSYTDKVTAPTCTEKGCTTHTCACGDSYKDSYVNALGHNYKDGACTRCGAKDPNYKEPTPTTVPGDINGDGAVNVLDLIRLKKHLAGAKVELVGSADVNGDGAVNVLDLIRLKKFLAGADVTLN